MFSELKNKLKTSIRNFNFQKIIQPEYYLIKNLGYFFSFKIIVNL